MNTILMLPLFMIISSVLLYKWAKNAKDTAIWYTAEIAVVFFITVGEALLLKSSIAPYIDSTNPMVVFAVLMLPIIAIHICSAILSALGLKVVKTRGHITHKLNDTFTMVAFKEGKTGYKVLFNRQHINALAVTFMMSLAIMLVVSCFN